MPESVLAGTEVPGAGSSLSNAAVGQPATVPLAGLSYTATGGHSTQEQSASGLPPNLGNPVFTTSTQLAQRTTELYKGDSIYDNEKPLPERFDNPALTQGYNTSSRSHSNPMYATSASVVGGIGPSVHTMPTQFHGRSQGFSNHLANSGMPCNRSLNTHTDRSRAHASLDQTNTIWNGIQGAQPRH